MPSANLGVIYYLIGTESGEMNQDEQITLFIAEREKSHWPQALHPQGDNRSGLMLVEDAGRPGRSRLGGFANR